jgi:hypothetical protein
MMLSVARYQTTFPTISATKGNWPAQVIRSYSMLTKAESIKFQTTCGTFLYISLEKGWSLKQVKTFARAVVFCEGAFGDMLGRPHVQREPRVAINFSCENSATVSYKKDSYKQNMGRKLGMETMIVRIAQAKTISDVVALMHPLEAQPDDYYLDFAWDFNSLLADKPGSIPSIGYCLPNHSPDAERCLHWTEFVIDYVMFALTADEQDLLLSGVKASTLFARLQGVTVAELEYKLASHVEEALSTAGLSRPTSVFVLDDSRTAEAAQASERARKPPRTSKEVKEAIASARASTDKVVDALMSLDRQQSPPPPPPTKTTTAKNTKTTTTTTRTGRPSHRSGPGSPAPQSSTTSSPTRASPTVRGPSRSSSKETTRRAAPSPGRDKSQQSRP